MTEHIEATESLVMWIMAVSHGEVEWLDSSREHAIICDLTLMLTAVFSQRAADPVVWKRYPILSLSLKRSKLLKWTEVLTVGQHFCMYIYTYIHIPTYTHMYIYMSRATYMIYIHIITDIYNHIYRERERVSHYVI